MKKIILIILVGMAGFACNNAENNLFQKAQKLQQQNEYLQASEIYAQILQKFPESKKRKEVESLIKFNKEKHNEITANFSQINQIISEGKYQDAFPLIKGIKKERLGSSYQSKLTELSKKLELEKRRNYLGGGYQSLKWEMSQQEVQRILSAPILKSRTDYIKFNLGNHKTLECHFYNNRLYRVYYTPNITENSSGVILAVMKALEQKFGTPDIQDMANGYGDPVAVVEWNDAHTEIRAISEGLVIIAERMGGYRPQNYNELLKQIQKGGSFYVSYSSKDIIKEQKLAKAKKEQEETARQESIKNKQIKLATQNLANEI
ncbi:hypothetical protein [Candidatus Avelusimicrobium alvi]|uniref:hypothetical protein n=1 Tax=Candidatus Avelusimicrobium alvi TaxID=3416221 RepID=UPI003D10BDAB